MFKNIVKLKTVPSDSIKASTAHTALSVVDSTTGKAGALALAFVLATSGSLAFAQSEKPQFIPFSHFIENTRTANSGALRSKKCGRVFSTGTRESM